MRIRYIALLWLSLISTFASMASEKPLPFRVGEVTLNIPVPDGFANAGAYQELYALRATTTPPGRHLLTFLVPENALSSYQADRSAAFDESLTVQTQANISASITAVSFAESKNKLRDQLEKITADVIAKSPERFRTISQEASRQLNTRVEVKVGEVVQLGIFEESDASISFAFLSTIQTQTSSAAITETAVTAQTIALIKNKMVWLLTRLPYGSQADIERAKALSKLWLANIRSVN